VTNQTRPRPEVVYESVSQFGFAEMIVREAVVLLVLAFAALALPKSEEKKDRVFDRELSDKEALPERAPQPPVRPRGVFGGGGQDV
jgi:hypothetical protein